MRTRTLGIVLLAALAWLTPAPSGAQTRLFLKLDGIEGESNDDRHRGEIELLGFGQGLSAGTFTSGGGGGGERPTFQPIKALKRIDKASPKLFITALRGQHVRQAIISFAQSGGERQVFFQVTLDDVLIAGLSTTSDAGGLPQEVVALDFGKICWEYTVITDTGAAGGKVSGCWDRTTNTGS